MKHLEIFSSNLRVKKEELPDYSKNLIRLRKEKGWTQKEAAYYLSKEIEEEIKLGRFQAYEEGRAEPPIKILIGTANIYDTNVDSLLKTA